MPRARAQLVNGHGQVTRHDCVRLEIRGHGPKRGIYAVYRCSCTGEERDYGYLSSRSRARDLRRSYPGVRLIDISQHEAA